MLLAWMNQFVRKFGYESKVYIAWIEQFKNGYNIKQVSNCVEVAGINQHDVDA